MNGYYLDTQIWIDHYLKRGINGENALKFLKKVIGEDSIIFYSDFTITELKKTGFFESEINEMLRFAKPRNIRRIHLTKIQIDEAVKLAKQRGIPYGDALHAILARDHEVQLVARDLDFQKLKDITKSKLPEELI
ncbi:PIN domain-containing protein [Candidatus Woesearchaeota archaeon]|nr:PIN domain-containing protein [Candidatus Woesearchaeota archaeon]